ncbi:MAG: nuclear transport factor 2 family protein [Ginsengibacter sp.]
MKKMRLLALSAFFVLTSQLSFAQQPDDVAIRAIENDEREAILKGDTATLLKLLSPHVVVHNPENTIITFDKITQRIRSGKIDYSSLERVIENMLLLKI